ncbi:MAG: hypothetical protein NC212_06025 [Staphylococcus sp.]|nr:hypothetical protein [Staphylococcus sp.]
MISPGKKNQNTHSRRHTAAVAAVVMVLLSVLCSCGGGQQSPVPKPEGWPRIEMPAPEFTLHRHDGVELLFNSNATVNARREGEAMWIDVRYPNAAGGQIFLSLTKADGTDALQAAIDNRHERMALNSGGASTELTELVSEGGWVCELAVTRSSVTTPVQILAYDREGHILSGALYFNLPAGAAADSISPVVRAVGRDLTETLKHLRSS